MFRGSRAGVSNSPGSFHALGRQIAYESYVLESYPPLIKLTE